MLNIDKQSKKARLSSSRQQKTMNTRYMDYMRYAERAELAVSSADRTVSMLGMMCAVAADQGEIVAFASREFKSNWPDPRIGKDRGFGPNFPGVSEEDL
jgi:hypothetical protein